MVSLDLNKMTRRLGHYEERAPEEPKLPSGVSKENFDLFLRVLNAKTPAEIEDIPTEKVLGMFNFAESICDLFIEKPLLCENLFAKLSIRKSLVTKRRIL